jgi:hypothetical protein
MGLYPNYNKTISSDLVYPPINVKQENDFYNKEVIPIHSNSNEHLIGLRARHGGCNKARIVQ